MKNSHSSMINNLTPKYVIVKKNHEKFEEKFIKTSELIIVNLTNLLYRI